MDGLPVEGTWRAHQVPLAGVRENPEHLRQLERWLRSYRPEELFDADGRPGRAGARLRPRGRRAAGRHPARQRRPARCATCRCRRLERFAVPVDKPGDGLHEPTRVLGGLLDRSCATPRTVATSGSSAPTRPPPTGCGAVYDATGKAWQARTLSTDEHLDRHGRVMEILSEHLCQGWLEGYLLTGRHGLFSCYEAFVHIVDSMVNQHIKWLKTSAAAALAAARSPPSTTC